jgi:lipoprotein-releasing system permease protein
MNIVLAWRLAVRYVRGKGSANAVPVLSRISMVAVAIGCGAMITLLSAFNGMESLIKDLYKAFYPDVRITAARGKFFSLTDDQLKHIAYTPGVGQISKTIEDNVFVTSSDSSQKVITLKGIDKNYFNVNDVRSYIVDGADSVSNGDPPTAIAGELVAEQMKLDVNNVFTRVNIFYSNPKVQDPSLDPLSAIRSLVVKPTGRFMVEQEFDEKYVLAPLEAVQNLFVQPGKYSAIEIKASNGISADDMQAALQKLLGKAFKVETRYEQNKTLYLTINTEKWATFAILTLVLLIASINMIGALTLLVLEKKKDIAILKAMGAQPAIIRGVFVMEGVLWSLIGGGIGLILGLLLCLGQLRYGWVRMSAGFIVDSYPIHIKWTDLVLVMLTILLVGVMAALYPAYRSTKTEDPSLKSA